MEDWLCFGISILILGLIAVIYMVCVFLEALSNTADTILDAIGSVIGAHPILSIVIVLIFVGVVSFPFWPIPTAQDKIDEIEALINTEMDSLHNAQQSFRRELVKHPCSSEDFFKALDNKDSKLRKEPWFPIVKGKWDAWQRVLSTFPFEKVNKFWDVKNQVKKADIGSYKFFCVPELRNIVNVIDSQSTDSNVPQLMKQTLYAIPRLSLSPGEFPQLPTVDELFNKYDPNKSDSVLELVRNICSKTIEKSNKDTESFLNQKQYEAACYCQCEAIDSMIAEIKKLDESYQNTPLGLLKLCRTEVVILLCRPHQELIKANRGKLTKSDSDQVTELWEQILDSLEDIQFIYPDGLKDKHLQKDIAELKKLLEFYEKGHRDSFSFIRKRMNPFIEK